ncbi:MULTISPECIES: RNA 2',3'-cyclic phosphodiesterase [unclassified Paenibacillus]|uniref:RNA 2',3'-cyclic phosphodiesterase n=1 Tax=unclassified Paenibacillus TaxID=185978 RepID=UPI001AEA1318|nr:MULTISPECIES: RNA 2',3'-cyclic phosphodiesterase [unclassified Paenibacillus]MBP1154421.1 2'-5' RNA ligase [Paenibacillus sp. PvP091]MBP1170195.1 2'-5' RNA ligase [Paenibacillus sp. PvR098]MBP2441223.1 2'-5' RNA ligase [Paenibacillus sp. PvP052]
MTEPRLFVAIPIPEEIRSVLKEDMESMKERYSFQKWVHPQDLHVTLKFLGATSQATHRLIVQSLSDMIGSFTAFDLQLESWGAFGRPASPSILWAGVGGDLTRLSALQSNVEHAAAEAGFEREHRRYSPHITVARKYNGKSAFQLDPIITGSLKHTASPLAWRVQQVVLYQSHLHRTPMYEAVEHFTLTKDE